MRTRLFDSLSDQEQQQFIALLRKFVHLNNEASRAPLQSGATAPPD